jgi:hypothetical protein
LGCEAKSTGILIVAPTRARARPRKRERARKRWFFAPGTFTFTFTSTFTWGAPSLGNNHQPHRDNVRDPAPLPPCFHTRFTVSQTTEAHFIEVASIEDEPEAVEVGRGVVKTRFNQGCSAPLCQYLDVRM